MHEAAFGALRVQIHGDRRALGAAAAARVASAFRAVCDRAGEARAIFACAPSQDEFLDALVRENVPWHQVTIFHMDEYVALPAAHPASFRQYLRDHLLARIPEPKAVHLIRAESSPDAECARYSALLAAAPIDLVCMGIGENGHLAFNDPPVADFSDPHLVKMVVLDPACRTQQVHDGCFSGIAAVPTHALTLTIPALTSAAGISCAVPGPRKARAVFDALHGPISTDCPASILRTHPGAILHIDAASAALLPP